MAVLTNVFRRGGVFYFRASVPLALRQSLGRKELWKSLRTREPGQAKLRGSALLGLTENLWRDLERAMSADEIEKLINSWLKARLEEDTAARTGISAEALALYSDAKLSEFGGALLNKTTDDPREAEPHVQAILDTIGITLTPVQFTIATRLMMRAHYDFYRALAARKHKRWRPWLDANDPAEELVQRVKGASVAPSQSVLASPAGPKMYGRLREISRKAIAYIAQQERFAPKRVADYEAAVSTFIDAQGSDPDLGEVTHEIAARYMRDLTRYPSNCHKRKPYRDLTTFPERLAAATEAQEQNVLSYSTINTKYLTPLRKIFAWQKAVSPDLANPFNGVVASKPRRGDPNARRRSLSDAEVIRLFDLPVFTGAAGTSGPTLHQRGSVKVDDWRFWVPLICMFSGMRLNEACGLAVENIRTDFGIVYFDIRDDEALGQKVKSDAALRTIPVHDRLIEVGFLRFVERQRQLGRQRLFEELELDASGYFSGKASKFFANQLARIVDKEGARPGRLVFHSTRHTVVTRLRGAEVREDVSKTLVGHGMKGDTHSGYGETLLRDLQVAVNKIEYPGLDLSRARR